MNKLLLLGSSLLLAGCVTANQIPPKVTPVNKPLQIDSLLSVNPDCSNLGYAEARIISAPANGTVTFTKGTVFPTFNSNNSRIVCNTKRVPAVLVTYSPRNGFIGTDTVTIEAIFASGNSRTGTYTINVK